MNIFFIDKSPFKSAEQLCDKHVVKMVLETAQMCSTALHKWHLTDLEKGRITDCSDEFLNSIYKEAFPNHPMNVWVRKNSYNMNWAIQHGLQIGKEYKYRYGRDHKSTEILERIKTHYLSCPVTHEDYKMHTPPPQCMPDEFKCDDYIEAYREYYRKDKSHILKWTNRPQPDWI